MTVVSLGDVAQAVMGQAPPGKECNKTGEGTVFVKAGEFNERFPVVREWTTKPLKFAKDGDVLVCVVGATAGKVNQAINCAIGRSVAAIRPNRTALDTSYLYHFLSRQTHNLRSKSQGLAQGVITRNMLHELEIPLPSLEAQRRIAAILDQADALRRLCQRSIVRLNDFVQATYNEMFVVNACENWKRASIDDVSSNMRTGPFGSQLLHSEFVDDGVSVLGIDNAVDNEFRWFQRRYITEEKYKSLRRYTVNPGDVLITIMGTCGRCAIVPEDIPKAINTKHLCCITLDRSRVLPEFLHATFLQHPDVLRQLGVQAKGAVMPGLNMGIIKNLEIPVPPLKLQERFAEQTRVAVGVKHKFERASESAHDLFASLQQRAFRGEL
jgi:type I restriction enzyme S subunit